MLTGLLKLTWLEIKIFVREPLGVVGTVLIPVLVFLVIGRSVGGRGGDAAASPFVRVDLPVFAAILVMLSAVLSLVTIVAIYREGGILKRLRATPLQPPAILGSLVLTKLLFTAITAGLLMLAGKRYYPEGLDAPFVSFGLALLLATFSTLSIGFIIASVIPTARFAQPVASLVLYPLVGISGLFFPLSAMPAPVRVLGLMNPLTYSTSLLRGIWTGEPWTQHLTDVAALIVIFGVCLAISTRVFRWE